MEATIRITDGKKTKYVTKTVADDIGFMRRFGFWKESMPKGSIKKADEAIVTESGEVNLLAETETVVEMTKNQIMEALKVAGIKFNPMSKKEVLQELLSNTK